MYKFYCINDSLGNRKEITEDKFKWLTQYNDYEYYGFDSRIDCFRFVKRNFNDHCDNPVWLLIEVIENAKEFK